MAVLFSGGKDSAYALHKALSAGEVPCLVSIVSENQESYMFHTPNIGLTAMQAQAAGIPLIQKTTAGIKEDELKDLGDAIGMAKSEYGIEGVVTGAIESVYQAARVQKICSELDLWCFNPLWKKDQMTLLREIVGAGFEAIISGVFAYPLTDEWLGRTIDGEAISELGVLRVKHKINPSGEGGEYETTVLDAPYFQKRLQVEKYRKEYANHSGRFIVEDAALLEK